MFFTFKVYFQAPPGPHMAYVYVYFIVVDDAYI